MPDPPAAPPTLPPRKSQQTGLPGQLWEWWHTAALVLILAFFSWMAIWPRWTLYQSWLVVVFALVGFIVIAGLGVTGAWRGAFIDERNMISLSRFQMLVWTVLVLSAYGAITISRAQTDPTTALDVGVPQTLWILMGISTTSLVGSPLLKNTKKDPNLALRADDQAQVLDNQREGLAEHVRVEGRIVSKKSIEDARWSDLFIGEEVSNVAHLNLAKIQMFFFTVLVVLSYGVAVGKLLVSTNSPAALPDIGEGMLALFGISHGGYLIDKAVPSARSQ